MKAFTYLVINKIDKRWYYGVRYAKGCDPSDMLRSYKTSSENVKRDIKILGVENFSCKIRKTFDDVKKALEWETKLLVKINAAKREDSYNLHNGYGHLPVMKGDENPSRRPEIREKLRKAGKNRPPLSKESIEKSKYTKMHRNILSMFKDDDFKIQKSVISKYRRYLTFLLYNKSNCVLMINKVKNLIEQCENIKNKPYPKNRKSGPRGKVPKIGESKKNSIWITSPDLKKMKVIYNKKDIPEGWIFGACTTQRVEKIRKYSIGRKHTVESKKKLSDNAKKKIYYTSPDLKILKIVYDIKDAPEGWIKGNKLKSRNEKISKSIKRRHRNEKNN